MIHPYLRTPAAIPFEIAYTLSVGTAVVAFPRSLVSPGARAFAWWLVAGAVSSVITAYFALNGVPNHDLFRYYQLLSVLLLGLVGSRLLADPQLQRVAVVTAGLYSIFWAVMVRWVEAKDYFSNYTAPGEQAVCLVLGVLLVAQGIRSSDGSPWRHAETWIGLGLVLTGGTGVIRAPIAGEVAKHSPELARNLYTFTGFFTDIALILYCIAYRSRRIVWTR